MHAFFNIGSLLIGFTAWILGAAAIGAGEKMSRRLSVLSAEMCSLALLFQIFEIGNRVYLEDYAAIADTIRAIAIAAIVLIGGTVVLNSIAINKKR